MIDSAEIVSFSIDILNTADVFSKQPGVILHRLLTLRAIKTGLPRL